jgi:UMF1 family MFS transporter
MLLNFAFPKFNLNRYGVAMIVPLFAAIGGYAWFRFQRYSGWSTKAVLVTNLFLLSWLPLWGCVGFFSDSIGLRTAPEMFILAVWFGFCLAGLYSC